MKQTRFGALLLTLCLLLSFAPAIAAPAAIVPQQTDWRYGDQLEGLALVLYEALADATEPGEITLPLPEPITFGVAANADQAAVDAARDEAVRPLSMAFQSAFDALFKDCPYQFWIGVGAGGTTFSYTYSSLPGEQRTWIIRKITINLRADADYATDPAGAVAAVRGEVASFAVEGSSRYERLLSIHDGLAARIVYDLTAPHAHEAYGALLHGRSVCEGYAKSFQMLCLREGIPCVLVTGMAVDDDGAEAHMWNLVQMEDGAWYAVDLTWDDQENGLRHEFFLTGAEELAPAFGPGRFEQTHQANGDFSGTGAKVFDYPPLSDTAYPREGGTTVPTITTESNIIPTESEAPTQPTQSDTVTFPTSTAPTKPLQPLLGDINRDGTINTTDARLALQYAVEKIRLDEAQLAAGDVDGNGIVNTTDARLILQYAVEKIDRFPAQQ